MLINNRCFAPLIFGFILSFGLQAHPADFAKLTLQMKSDLLSGNMKNGRCIGTGRVSSYEPGTHLQVWSEASNSTPYSNHYIMQGLANSNHKLYIRLEGVDWKPDSDGGKGILIHSLKSSEDFRVLIDGDQNVKADKYFLTLRGEKINL